MRSIRTPILCSHGIQSLDAATATIPIPFPPHPVTRLRVPGAGATRSRPWWRGAGQLRGKKMLPLPARAMSAIFARFGKFGKFGSSPPSPASPNASTLSPVPASPTFRTLQALRRPTPLVGESYLGIDTGPGLTLPVDQPRGRSGALHFSWTRPAMRIVPATGTQAGAESRERDESYSARIALTPPVGVLSGEPS